MGESNSADIDMAAASKVEPARDGTPSSLESSPEPDLGLAEPSQEPAQPQKRKGGRKPIYATSEERKQRNRQAQAAFRERRTEYIKQLEATIKQNEETLTSLQQSHRTAADECLMLRYKNSLLERILLEKGIDVQAELQMKTGSPVLGPGFLQNVGGIPQQPQLQRTALQRQQARRSGSNFLPKLAPGQSGSDVGFSMASPHAHPTPSSHASSPSQLSTRSPLAMHQGGMTPPVSAVVAQPHAQQFANFARSSQQPFPNQSVFQVQHQSSTGQRSRPTTSSTFTGSASGLSNISVSSQSQPPMSQLVEPGSASNGGPQSASSFYPSPFQKHFDQLDQEYDAQQSQSMLDDPETDDIVKSPQLQESFPTPFDDIQAQPSRDFYHQQGHQQMAGPQPKYEQGQMIPPTSHPSDSHFDPSDPMLDADPFGLSASMHYPTQYTFDQQQQHQQHNMQR